MNDKTRETIEAYLTEVSDLHDDWAIQRWEARVAKFLERAVGPEEAAEFKELHTPVDFWDGLALERGHLEGLLAKDEGLTGSAQRVMSLDEAVRRSVQAVAASNHGSRRVFLVHGHDGETKEAVARFLERLGLKPVILHEQPNEGRTIIEKFEVSSEGVGFAVVLLTPDDIGAEKSRGTDLRNRARQNVILELGYFMGRLGRSHVCALYKAGIELPSDFQGIVYIELDAGGGWRAKLAQELVQAKCPIELKGLIES